MPINFTVEQLLDIYKRAQRTLTRARRIAKKRFGGDFEPGYVTSARIYRDFTKRKYKAAVAEADAAREDNAK